MSQWDVIDWLKNRRVLGDHSFHSSADIQKGLKSSGMSFSRVDRVMDGLYACGLVDMRLAPTTSWRRRYRFKVKKGRINE